MIATTTATLTALSPLCGHVATATSPGCDPYEQRNTVVDHIGDVVLFKDCDGALFLFRDGVDDGLRLAAGPAAGTWTLTRTRQVEVAEDRWETVADAAPLCIGGPERDGSYAARHIASGRVVARIDTHYGLLGRVARFYLRAVSGCE